METLQLSIINNRTMNIVESYKVSDVNDAIQCILHLERINTDKEDTYSIDLELVKTMVIDELYIYEGDEDYTDTLEIYNSSELDKLREDIIKYENIYK